MKTLAHLRYLMLENPLTLAAAVLALLLLVGAVLGPSLAPYDPLATNTSRALEPPSWDHWFGTDPVGRDIFSRLIVAVQISLNMGWSILNAASLSFIGLGVRPPTPEWGIMVADGASYIISGEWWVALFPGAALMVAVFCFNLLGDGLRDLIDPRQRT
jgi:ABC-type dipeptide/oligopeptide/nickel transport system permease subunit